MVLELVFVGGCWREEFGSGLEKVWAEDGEIDAFRSGAEEIGYKALAVSICGIERDVNALAASGLSSSSFERDRLQLGAIAGRRLTFPSGEISS
jgi:hypothetical protein